MAKLQITLEDLFEIPGAEIFYPDEFKPVSSVSIDSRNLKKNSLFIAIKGEKFDGHAFIRDAVKNGASALMINKNKVNNYEDTGIPFITVKNTTIALGHIAQIWREKLKAKIIGITGSTGKTSTKEMLSLILQEKYSVNKTLANNNNHIGVPLTILSTNEKHDVLVAELGTNHFGEIDYTSKILMPEYAVITNVGYSHLEYLKNKRGVLKEKLALFEAAALKNGTLFINNDDKLLKNSLRSYPNKITFGFDYKSDVLGKITSYTEDGRANIEIKYKNKVLRESVPVYGEQSAKNLLVSTAIAFKLGLSGNQISQGIRKLSAFDKRLNVKRNNKFFLIDDTYNANPESMKAALDLLGRISIFKKKIAIIGDMFELGDEAPEKHKEAAKPVKKNKIDEVYTIGKLTKYLDNALSDSRVKTRHFSRREALHKFLSGYDFTGSVILVKGSRGMKMEEFVKTISGKLS